MPLLMASNNAHLTDAFLMAMTALYPINTKQAAGIVDGLFTDVMVMSFADKIMVTITQEGRLAQWIHVSLDSVDPVHRDHYLPTDTDLNGLLPMPHLTPKTLLGGSTNERETIGQLYATHIASAIATKDPQENRTVLVGLGLSHSKADREVFFDLLELAMKCL